MTIDKYINSKLKNQSCFSKKKKENIEKKDVLIENALKIKIDR